MAILPLACKLLVKFSCLFSAGYSASTSSQGAENKLDEAAEFYILMSFGVEFRCPSNILHYKSATLIITQSTWTSMLSDRLGIKATTSFYYSSPIPRVQISAVLLAYLWLNKCQKVKTNIISDLFVLKSGFTHWIFHS